MSARINRLNFLLDFLHKPLLAPNAIYKYWHFLKNHSRKSYIQSLDLFLKNLLRIPPALSFIVVDSGKYTILHKSDELKEIFALVKSYEKVVIFIDEIIEQAVRNLTTNVNLPFHHTI